MAYWVKNFKIFEFQNLSSMLRSGGRIKTHDNNLYVRNWWEVYEIGDRWIPYTNGGEYRKWYGDYLDVVDWSEKAREFYGNHGGLCKEIFWFKEGLTWGAITSGDNSYRIKPKQFMFSSASPTVFTSSFTCDMSVLAFLNTKVAKYISKIINPTLNQNVNDTLRIPYYGFSEKASNCASKCIEISKIDWDSFETSWDFQHHPLLRKVPTIAEAFDQWQTECDDRFRQLKANEEELNRIFIDIYGLEDELTPEVEDKDVTVRKADLGRDIRSFISYAMGCMFGRYSLDVDGLAYAGGEWDASKYASLAADKDNIIPICDDEYFEDDIVGLFVEFVKTVYGTETLDENLKFIADALGGKGQPKDVIRNYFLSEFYSDHCKIYQKRPIYWLFDSGKKNGFKALIYMHRYQPDTIARIRTKYVFEQQDRYHTAIADLERRIANASTGERVKLNKKLTTLQAQDTEIGTYEEKIHHLADQMISIDLDDGVKKNYAIFKDVLAKIK